MLIDDLVISCELEPEDDRNYLRVEDNICNISVTVQHVAYGFWYRLKCVVEMLIKGYSATDITVSKDNVTKLYNWLTEYRRRNDHLLLKQGKKH